MASVAEQLRRGREAQKLTHHQVADAIKLRSDHVIALEEGNYDVFAAPVYIRGFVRSYGQLLKLDVAALMTELEHELSKSEKHHEPPPLTPRTRNFVDMIMYQLTKVNWKIAAPIGVIALLVGAVYWILVAWKTHQARDPLAKLGPGVYEAPKASDTLPVPQHH